LVGSLREKAGRHNTLGVRAYLPVTKGHKMRCNFEKWAFFAAVCGVSLVGRAWAQPATPAAKAAGEQAQVEARARDLAAAGDLLRGNQFVAAIAAYQKILADNPDADTKMAAELGLGKALAGQDPAKGVERLQAFLERYDDADPKIVASARTALTDAREALANSYLSAKQFDKAIAALAEIAKDKNADEARAGQALEAIAKIHLQLGDKKKAVEAYQQLLRRPAADAGARLAQIRNLLAIDPTATSELEKFLAANPGAPGAVLAEAYVLLGNGYAGAGEHKKSLDAFQRAAGIKGATSGHVEAARVGAAQAYHRLGETKKAVDVYRRLLNDPGLEPARRFAFVRQLREIDPSADIMPDIAFYLNHLHRWQDLSPAAFDAAGLPANDVIIFATKSRQQAIDAHKWELRRRTGRATPAQVEAFAKSIDSPGKKEAFSVSAASKALADAVSEKAPMGLYFKTLLSGDHEGAAKLAWQLAHAPRNEPRYEAWLEAVAKAVQCHDQAFGGRTEAFLKWNNGSLVDAAGQRIAANPIADVVGPKPEPTEISDKTQAAAQAFFNRLDNVRGLAGALAQQQRQNASWLPANDVLILSIGGAPSEYALPAYAWHLRRTEGRAEPEKLKAVETQLAKGGDARPFVVSDASKKLAADLADNAPLAYYLKPLLSGDYQTAARVAWQHLLRANTQEAYDAWAEGVAIALRCQDQQLVGGRAEAFSRWVRDDLADAAGKKISANPAAEFLDVSGRALAPGSPGAIEPAQPSPEVVAHLNGTRSVQDLKLSAWAPATDVLNLTVLDPGQILERLKWHQRQTTGRMDAAALQQIHKQLTEGGKLRPLTVSATSKALAAQIRDDAPLADYLRALLTGDHRQAVQVAWGKMLAAQTDDEYAQWLAAAVAAVRCHDQSLARAEQFRQWMLSDLKDKSGKPVETNPIQELVRGTGEQESR